MRDHLLLRAVLLLILVSAPGILTAHEVRPAYLELRPAGPMTWSVLWKVPALGQSLRLRVDARLPDDCTALGPRRAEFVADAYVERWILHCATGLAGGIISFDGLSALRNEALLRIERPDRQDGITARVTPATPTFTIPAEPLSREVIETYLLLGVRHILLGADHLLFVLGLLLIVCGWRRLTTTITAFTIGHTLTLAAAALGTVSLPGPPVEAAIALSIAFAAAKALRVRRGEPSLMVAVPWAVVLLFGLLHGLGWAVRRLAAGNRLQASAGRLLPRAHSMACYAIGVTAAFWLIERVQGFWS